ncbi:hypothetical protein ACFLXE_00335 [Chloroflexota bacterium]
MAKEIGRVFWGTLNVGAILDDGSVSSDEKALRLLNESFEKDGVPAFDGGNTGDVYYSTVVMKKRGDDGYINALVEMLYGEGYSVALGEKIS